MQQNSSHTGKWIIVYDDGAFESNHGSGFPCHLLGEAAMFDTKEEAEEHSASLCDVKEIKQLS